MTMQQALQAGELKLTESGITEAKIDAWYLLEFVTGVSRAMYYAFPDKLLTDEQERKYTYYIEQRSLHIPLQHLTGEQEFMGLTFKVNEHVLIPRQDTETLVEEAVSLIESSMKEKDKIKVLDMCTGSGCILLSILKYATRRDKKITGTGADISEEALKVARFNSENLGIDAQFIQSDLFEHVEGRFDVITSNPPYIRTEVIHSLQEEVKLHDPWIALDGKEDGLFFYRKIISSAGQHLQKGGFLIFEIGHDQGMEVSGLMEKAGFKDVRVKKDLPGLDRVVIGMYDR